MANEKHLLLTFTGGYDDSSLAAEGWSTGIRLALDFTTAPSGVFTLSNDWDPVAHSISRTEADWTISGNWWIQHLLAHVSPDDYLNDQVAPAWAAFLGGADYSAHAVTHQIKLAVIGTNGKEVPAPPYAVGTPCLLTYTSSAPTGGSGGNMLPLQNTVAHSLRTDQIGRRGRGRMFMPSLTVAALDAHGFVSSSQLSNMRDNLVAFCEALKLGSGGGPYIRPIVTGHPWTTAGLVSSVRVGNVVDTQRRRRRSLVETVVTGTPSY